MLGASTKHFKTYGKRKVNVVNKRVVLGDQNSNSNSNNNNNKVKSGGWSDSSSSDSEEEEQIIKEKPIVIEGNKKKPKIVVNRNRKNDPSQLDKENSTSSTESSSTSKTTGSEKSLQMNRKKKQIESVVVVESSEESSDLANSFQPRVPLKKKPVVTSREPQAKPIYTRVIESEEESEEVVEIMEERERIEEILFLEDDDTPAAVEEEDSPDSVRSTESTKPSRPLPTLSPHPFPPVLSPLLQSTLSPTSLKPYDFTSFVNCPLSPFSLLSTDEDKPWRKVGEASYSEVFSTFDERGEEIVIKIIPIASTDPVQEQRVGEEDLLLPDTSDWESVKREIEISDCLGGETNEKKLNGFVKFRG